MAELREVPEGAAGELPGDAAGCGQAAARDLLLDQTAMATVVPVIQYDWKRPFRIAWI